jgi:hypothetical protein
LPRTVVAEELREGTAMQPPAGQIGIPNPLRLASGLSIADPERRLERFSRAEYAYYDAVYLTDPDRIEPIDVMVTWAVNSNIYEKTRNDDPASKLRDVHQGVASKCERHLAGIPEQADLLSFDPSLEAFERLITNAMLVKWVGVAVATKILHRKRRNFIPMLDSYVMKHYLSPAERTILDTWPREKTGDIPLALKATRGFRDDLRRSLPVILSLQARLRSASFELTPVRILEILVWTEKTRTYR